ncbi:UTRA domain-containing protein [Micromonospora sp. SL1-18]|uniref:UTRA domain-containing protein n=1 Tax=Micromonospora sp. SL1-18 TaxID=3399128 RepID=UPI003A4DBCA8
MASRALRQTVVEFMYFSRFARGTGRAAGAKSIELIRRPAEVVAATALDIDPETIAVHVLRLRTLDGQPTMLERSVCREDFERTRWSRPFQRGNPHYRSSMPKVPPESSNTCRTAATRRARQTCRYR